MRRFPFAAILPVQPMSTIPSDAGVDVMFRKKPTREREGKDGGLVISIHQSPHGGTEMRVLRNTDGQSVSKSFRYYIRTPLLPNFIVTIRVSL